MPGFVEIDLVGHEGGVPSGKFCFTLTVTDIATGWTVNRSVPNKARKRVFAALQSALERFPFPIAGIASQVARHRHERPLQTPQTRSTVPANSGPDRELEANAKPRPRPEPHDQPQVQFPGPDLFTCGYEAPLSGLLTCGNRLLPRRDPGGTARKGAHQMGMGGTGYFVCPQKHGGHGAIPYVSRETRPSHLTKAGRRHHVDRGRSTSSVPVKIRQEPGPPWTPSGLPPNRDALSFRWGRSRKMQVTNNLSLGATRQVLCGEPATTRIL
ncbi:MAG: transposase family protein [Arthrobacter sp.]|nr:transposase family protein [Arthrobacter sp.]